MSESDNVMENCATSRARDDEKAMGDVLAKENNEDVSQQENTLSEDSLTINCLRHDINDTPESDANELSPTDTPLTNSVEMAENCEHFDNTEMEDNKDMEDNNVLLESNKDSSENSSDSTSRHVKDPCRCEMCRVKRRILMEDMERALRLNSLWTDLRKHIHSVYHTAMTTSNVSHSSVIQSDSSRQSSLQNTVLQLCKSDPHQLSMRLVSQAQEFVVEVKVQLLTLLQNLRVNHLAEVFLTKMLDGYDALIATALQVSQLIKPVEKEYFQKFNLTWECFNKKLYQDYVYTDPLIQNRLPPFIGQLRKLLPLKSTEYQGLVHRYLAFDDEMTRVGNLWPEAVQLIDKHNMEQAARLIKLRRFRKGWETFTTWWKQVQRQETYKRHERLQEVNNELLKECQEVSSTGTNGRVPSPVCLLDTLSIPPKHDIAQFLLDAKTSHQRLVDVLKSIIVSKDHLTMKDYGINMPNHPHMNDLEFQCGFECASTVIQSFATLIAKRRTRSNCSENHVDPSLTIDEENCTYCTLSPLLNSNLFMMKELSTEEESLSKDKSLNNDIAGMEKYIDTNFSAIKDLYNHVNSAIPGDNSDTLITQENLSTNFDSIESKTLVECETENDGSEEKRPNCVAEDVDFRKFDFQSCPCVYQHTKDIAEKRKEVDNPPCPCLLNSKRKLDACPCLSTNDTDIMPNGHVEEQPIAVTTPKSNEEPLEVVMKPSSTISAQIQTRHSTTQTRNSTHHHNRTSCQGSAHSHDVKTSNSGHKAHNHGSQSSIACHKQHVVEHIKRVSCSDLSPGDGDCSDSGSSHEDSCSTSSSSPRDSNRHCDCCYCEVFGHGVTSVALVSRNYNEMRDRLRQLLTKKKATKCKAVCSPSKSSAESLPSNTNSESKTTTSSHSAPRSNTPLSTASTVLLDNRDQRDLDALLEYIEGSQNGKRDNKKAEKKARQKQRKLEEKLKQERLEDERQKLIEIQKKTPEVTITVVDPQRPMPQRFHSHRNLPEVSILPASPPVVSNVLKPNNIKNKKKDKFETPTNINVTNKTNAKTKTTAQANQKTKSSISVDRVDGISNSTQNTKHNNKKEKGGNAKGNKTGNLNNNNNSKNTGKQTQPPPAPSPPPPPIDESTLTKKERKKLRREMRKMEEAKKETENQLQIVTIKRVMESNSAEPTVTITLKGQTPAEDKVLFTLVNGQTKEPTKTEQGQTTSGKKKKKGKNTNNANQASNNNQVNTSNQVTQNKTQQTNVKTNKNENKTLKQTVKQTTNNEKSKGAKQVDSSKNQQQQQQQQQSSAEVKPTKKNKKNSENKENVSQSQNNATKNKNQQQNLVSKKQNKNNSSLQVQQEKKQPNNNGSSNNNNNNNNETGNKKVKQQEQNKNIQKEAKKNNKSGNNKANSNNNNNNNSSNTNSSSSNSNCTGGKVTTNKTDNQKNQTKSNQNSGNKKKKQNVDVQRSVKECVTPPLSSQFKEISANSKINIENLKLPPGITITKVDTPVKPFPLKIAQKLKPTNPPKQTTIIASPMSNTPSGYANPQGNGNVIVVDTGKLKQDLIPKNSDKDATKESQGGKKKKKKKNKNAANQNNNPSSSSSSNLTLSQRNDHSGNDHGDDVAKILHNPQTNMVTIRNPAFGPPKMEPVSQQAAIIKVSENGMVTIRSPALQQAINAGLTPPPKPDFIIKGDLNATKSNKQNNGIIPSSITEIRSRLSSECTSLSDLANIQISKVASGQPIPESGINLKGTSVTLTKVRNPETTTTTFDEQAKTAVREAINASMAASSGGTTTTTSKGKKKKKRGNGARQSGDDWNLVESVFTPKDIDLEDGEMDDAERELEAFKRFCLQSVPPPRKEKVNLNIKDIVLKKKSSSSTSAAATAVIAAN